MQGVDANDTGQNISTALVEGIRPMTVSGVIARHERRTGTRSGRRRRRTRASLEAVALAPVDPRARDRAAPRPTGAGWTSCARRSSAPTDPRVIELDRKAPWHETVVTTAPEALYVIYPKSDGWGMQAVPKALGAFANRKDLPEAWAGHADAELAAVTGVDGRDVRPHEALLRLRGLPRGHRRPRALALATETACGGREPRGCARRPLALAPRVVLDHASSLRAARVATAHRASDPPAASPSSAAATSSSIAARCPRTRSTMPSSTPRADSIPPAALVRCSLIRRTSSIAPSARSTSARSAGASSPSTPPLAISTRARASEYATSSGQGALFGVEDDEQLVPADLAQRLRPRRQPVLGRDDPDAVVGRALGHRLLELRQRLLARLARVLGLEDDPAARGARAAVDVDHDVALAPAGAAEVADRPRSRRPSRGRSRPRPRPRPPRTGGPWPCRARPRRRPRTPSRARSAATAAPASSATICSRICSSWASWRVDASRAARRCAALKSASGFEPSAEENWRSRSSRIRADCSSITCRN